MPLFTHDCIACHYLGVLNGEDLYVHRSPNSFCLIRRYGNDGLEYYSMPGILPNPRLATQFPDAATMLSSQIPIWNAVFTRAMPILES